MRLSARALALNSNKQCPRLHALASAGISDTAAAKAYGYEGKSPRLSYVVGVAFEKRVTDNHDRLFELTGADAGKVYEITENLADSGVWEHTKELLADPETTIITQAAVPGLVGGWLRPDVIYKRHGKLYVGEIKIYLDKGGQTDAHSFGAAVTQAAAGVLALRNAGYTVPATVTIVLSSLLGAPTVRRVSCVGEIARLNALVDSLGYRGDSTGIPDVSAVEDVYSIHCVGACALAKFCRDKAIAAGELFPSDARLVKEGYTVEQLQKMVLAGEGAVGAGFAFVAPKNTES